MMRNPARLVPAPTSRLPVMAKLAPVVADADPLKVKLPATVVIAPKVLAPPLRVRW